MKKVLFVQACLLILLAGVMLVLLASPKVHEGVTAGQVEEIAEKSAIDMGLTRQGTLKVKKSFGINTEEYRDFLYYSTDDSMNVCEVLWLYANDDTQIKEALASMNERIETRKGIFENYGVNQFAQLQNARILSIGNYVCLIVSDDADELNSKIRKLLEE